MEKLLWKLFVAKRNDYVRHHAEVWPVLTLCVCADESGHLEISTTVHILDPLEPFHFHNFAELEDKLLNWDTRK